MSDLCSIRLLDDQVIGQIAAGEVVERPASVVKELVENGIDAKARRIDVRVLEGGRREIRVVDDGHGMSRAEVRLCLERHATSKLRCAEELLAVRTLGFRGEGLSSVAAVSRLTLTTCRQGLDEGTLLRADGGRLADVQPVGCRAGTTVTVRDLFYNTPARAKFLKSTATETAHVVDVVNRIALAFPDVHFSLQQGDRLAVDLPPRRARRDRAADVLGQELRVSQRQAGGLQVEAHLGSLERGVATTRSLVFVVNGRAVRDRILLQAVLAACESRISRGRYPVGVVYLDLSSDLLDVNVHPQKSEVRFADPRPVHRLVREAVAELAAHSPAPARVYKLHGAAEKGERAVASDERLEQARRRFWSPAADFQLPAELADYGLSAALARRDQAELAHLVAEPSATAEPRLVGLLSDNIVVCEWGDQVLLFDPLEGWMRVVALELEQALELGSLDQSLLPSPLQLSLSAEQSGAFERCLQPLRQLGFVAEPFGRESWLLRSVPTAIAGGDDEGDQTGDLAGCLQLRERLPRLVETLDGMPAKSPEVVALVAQWAAQRRVGCASLVELMRALRRVGDPASFAPASASVDLSRAEAPKVVSLMRAELLRRLSSTT